MGGINGGQLFCSHTRQFCIEAVTTGCASKLYLRYTFNFQERKSKNCSSVDRKKRRVNKQTNKRKDIDNLLYSSFNIFRVDKGGVAIHVKSPLLDQEVSIMVISIHGWPLNLIILNNCFTILISYSYFLTLLAQPEGYPWVKTKWPNIINQTREKLQTSVFGLFCSWLLPNCLYYKCKTVEN